MSSRIDPLNVKETILFVHGAWHGRWCWDKYWRATFEKSGYDVITFDLPGHQHPGKVSGIIVDDIAHDMMLDTRQDIAAHEIIQWLKKN